MKEFIEIPFGAKDSKLCGWEYTIPEGFVASIKNGKIVVKKEDITPQEKFTFVKIIHFDNCSGCPHNSFHDDDNDCTHNRCDKLNKYIKKYLNTGDKDFRNEDGVLDGCPFLENKIIAEES